MGFSRQKYWGGLPFPPPGDLSDPGMEPVSPESPVLANRFFTAAPRLLNRLYWQTDSLPLHHLGSHVQLLLLPCSILEHFHYLKKKLCVFYQHPPPQIRYLSPWQRLFSVSVDFPVLDFYMNGIV